MSDDQPAPPPSEAARGDKDDKDEKKKKDKIRSVWISFVGRVVAQVVGAVATIVLGLAIAGRLPGTRSGPDEKPPAPSERPAARPDSKPAGGRASLVVLPLQNLSGDPQQEFFADGMTEALISSLTKIRALRVISRTSAMQYKGTRKPLPEIARELSVDLILEGSVLRDGARVRITAQLIDAAADEHVWAESYDRPIKDVLALQADVATAIARQVDVVLSPGELGRLAPRGTVNPEAYAFYLKGRYAWNQRTREGFDSAIRYFVQAIGEDPNYAAAFAGLADTYSLQGSFNYEALPFAEAMDRAKRAADKAVALDEDLAEAQTSLAWVRYRYDWDWKKAEAGFRLAIDLNPGYVTAHQWYSILLGEQGRHDEALAEAQRALLADPQSPLMWRNLALVHYYARRFEEAEAKARDALELDSRAAGAHFVLARILNARGDHEGAIAAAERVPPEQRSNELLAMLGYAYAQAGQTARARHVLAQFQAAARQRPVAPHHEAVLQIGLGDKDAAFQAFERALAQRSPYLLGFRTFPLLDPLREDPRFQALVKKVGL